MTWVCQLRKIFTDKNSKCEEFIDIFYLSGEKHEKNKFYLELIAGNMVVNKTNNINALLIEIDKVCSYKLNIHNLLN